MNKKLLNKCFIFIGLLLFFTFILPQASLARDHIALASAVEIKENSDYRLNLKSLTLVKGKTFSLKVYNLGPHAKVSFKSADSEIASVSEDGTVTANKIGAAAITVTIKDGLGSTSLTCDVTVGPPAFSVKLTRSRIILGLDECETLTVILKPSNTAEEARFSSYDESIASVSAGGRVYGRNLGLTYVFAEIDQTDLDGSPKFAMCSIIVTNQDDAQNLNNYFAEHSEWNMIPECEMQLALKDFFNKTYEMSATVTPHADSVTKTITERLDKFLNQRFESVINKDKAETKPNINEDKPIVIIDKAS